MLSSIIGLVEVLTEDECNKIIAVLLAVHWCATLCSTASTSTTWFFEVCSYSWLDNDICPNLEVYFSLRILICSSDEVSEAMGYSEDAPVSLARDVRQNENCVWIADEALNDAIFERARACLPAGVDGGPLVGLNRRWRLYKYNPGDIFKVHTDGSWPGSGLDKSGKLVRDIFKDRWSQLTFVLYLNDDFVGGATRFFSRPNGECTASVPAERGAALCFFHGEHPWSPLHEGGKVTRGTKYIIRSDVLYRFPDGP